VSVIDPVPAPPRTARKTVVIAALALVVTFLAGFVAGVAAIRILHRNGRVPPIVEQTLLNRLDRQLDLTDQQRLEVKKIIERRHDRIEHLWANLHPQMRAEIERTNAEIERVLTPEQRVKFQSIRLHMRRGGKARTAPTR
jgi:Spy/CpxP family protein refolding chaperone